MRTAEYWEGKWQEACAEIAQLRADSDQVRALVRDISATRDTAVNMHLADISEIERLKTELARIRGLPRLSALDDEIERLTVALAGIACWSVDHSDAKARANRALERKP